MRDAFAPLSAEGCCLLVLTLDRYGKYSGEQKFQTAQEAYRGISALSNEFLKRLRKWCASQGWNVLGNQWVSTVEAHKKGWPHVNIVLHCPELAEWISNEQAAKLADGMSADEARFVSRELADIVTGAGWGIISTAERARSREESLGYICKTAGKVDESIGEIAKLSQLPTNAPFRFRRIRSGKGFLPPRAKNENVTGTLVRRQVSILGYDVIPLHDIKGEAAIAACEASCSQEERIWYAEMEARERCARQVKQFGAAAVELPPVTHWFRGQRLSEPIRSSNRDDILFGPAEILAQSAA